MRKLPVYSGPSLSGSHILLKLGVQNQFSLYVPAGVCTKRMGPEKPGLLVELGREGVTDFRVDFRLKCCWLKS